MQSELNIIVELLALCVELVHWEVESRMDVFTCGTEPRLLAAAAYQRLANVNLFMRMNLWKNCAKQATFAKLANILRGRERNVNKSQAATKVL